MLQPNQPIDRGRDPHISNLCESGCFGYPKKTTNVVVGWGLVPGCLGMEVRINGWYMVINVITYFKMVYIGVLTAY